MKSGWILRCCLIASFLVPGRLAAQQVQDTDARVAALMSEATLHMAEDRWAEAVRSWSMLLDLDPNHVVARLNRALSRMRTGDCEGRAQDARRVLEILDQPQTELSALETLVYRAQAHAHLSELDEAVRLLERAEQESPDDRPLGIVLSQMRRRAEGTAPWSCPPGS